jgi:lipoprotein NlpI
MFKNIELVIVFGLLSIMGCSNSDNNITQDKNKTVIEKKINKKSEEIKSQIEDILVDMNTSFN